MALLFAVLCAAAFAAGSKWDVVKVPFKFEAGDAAHPSGEYTIIQNNNGADTTIELRGGGAQFELQVVTRLAPEGKIDVAKLVFDRTGDRHVLSEVWLPGQDGFLVTATKGEHTHDVVRTEKGK
jgi:hypothetical protein